MVQTERNESAHANRRLIRMAALAPSVPEIRYLLARLLISPPTHKPFAMAWSLWRRRHQAAATTSRYWPGLCRAIGLHDLADDPQYNTDVSRRKNTAICIAELRAVFATRSLSEWETILRLQEGQWDEVQHPGELQYDRKVIANSYMQGFHDQDGRMLQMVSTPIEFDREALLPRLAPDVGAHSEEVSLGFDEGQIIDHTIDGIVP